MAKSNHVNTSSGKKSATPKRRLSASGAASLTLEMKVGAVTVEVTKPTREEVRRNIRAGQEALSRVRSRLLRPGVILDHAANVPLYHADPDNADLLIRVLRGKRTYGRFVDGKFQVVRAPGKKAAA